MKEGIFILKHFSEMDSWYAMNFGSHCKKKVFSVERLRSGVLHSLCMRVLSKPPPMQAALDQGETNQDIMGKDRAG